MSTILDSKSPQLTAVGVEKEEERESYEHDRQMVIFPGSCPAGTLSHVSNVGV